MVNKHPEKQKVTGIVDGVGSGTLMHLVAPGELPAKADLMAEVTLEPGASVGYHKHEGEGELYYLLSGSGEYTEDGVMTPVSAGMATYVYDGHSHGLVNTGKETMAFVAVVIKE